MNGKSSAHHASPRNGTQISCCFRKNFRNGMRRLNTACSTRMSTQDWWFDTTRYHSRVDRPSRPRDLERQRAHARGTARCWCRSSPRRARSSRGSPRGATPGAVTSSLSSATTKQHRHQRDDVQRHQRDRDHALQGRTAALPAPGNIRWPGCAIMPCRHDGTPAHGARDAHRTDRPRSAGHRLPDREADRHARPVPAVAERAHQRLQPEEQPRPGAGPRRARRSRRSWTG